MKSSTHTDLVQDLGGALTLSRALGLPTKTVQTWSDRDTIPWRWRHTLKGMAQRRGIPVPEGFTNPRKGNNDA